MDSIVDFHIYLDISDRQAVFDYSTEQFLLKPKDEGGWKFAVFGGNNNAPLEPAHAQRRQGMDKVIQEKRRLEKHYVSGASQGVDNPVMFGGFLDQNLVQLPEHVLPIYYPGETVRGTVVLEVSDPMKVKQVTLHCIGEACTVIYTSGDKGQRYKNVGREKYIDEKKVIWKGGKIYDDYGGVKNNTNSKRLPVEKIIFPFTFHLPTTAVPSLPIIGKLGPNSNKASITYKLRAVIEYGRCCASGDVVTCKGFLVDRRIPMGSTMTASPVTATKTLNAGLFGGSGEVKISATISGNRYIRRDRIPVTISIENDTDGTVDFVTSRVVFQGRTKIGRACCDPKSKIEPEGLPVNFERIAPRENRNFETAVDINFANSWLYTDLMPGGDLDDCKLIQVTYCVEVMAIRQGARQNLSVKLPFELYTEK